MDPRRPSARVAFHDGCDCEQRTLAGATAAIAQVGERKAADLKVPCFNPVCRLIMH